ncbi:MAG TPA: hypothetical protein ENI44_04975, partial [Thermoplasmatales archaeon]|nr:hypothetical protein [Thermoplasmatales archaeon]
MNNAKKTIKLEAVAFAVLLLGSIFFIPVGSVGIQEKQKMANPIDIWGTYEENKDTTQKAYKLDRKYIIDETQPMSSDDDNKDAGTKTDAGDKVSR